MTEALTMVQPRTLRVDTTNPEMSVIDSAVDILQSGGLVVAPTETRYGILANVNDAAAVERIFEIKGREGSKPSAVFISSVPKLDRYAEMNETSIKLASEFLPGPLTLVLRMKQELGRHFTLDGYTGLRISSSQVVRAISEKCGFLLSATSANLSGEPDADSIVEIKEQLGDKIDIYIDGGELNNPTSTVVQVVGDEIRILRAGAISETDIFKAIK